MKIDGTELSKVAAANNSSVLTALVIRADAISLKKDEKTGRKDIVLAFAGKSDDKCITLDEVQQIIARDTSKAMISFFENTIKEGAKVLENNGFEEVIAALKANKSTIIKTILEQIRN